MNGQKKDSPKPSPSNAGPKPAASAAREPMMGLKAVLKLGGIYTLKGPIFDRPEQPIWLADDEVLGKDVALHFLPETVANNKVALEKVREGLKKTRQLIHPNILRVYDLVDESDLAAISTEAFEGRSLDKMLAEREGGFYEPSDAKPLLRQLCQTLADAHRINAVHGALSPRNVIITPDGRVLLFGFETSRPIAETLKGEAGNVLTPQQLAGAPSSPSDDVYGLGRLLYEVLSGEAPPAVTGENPVALPKMMDTRAKADRRGGTILPLWEKVVAACLSPRTEERPGSIAEIAEKLGIFEKRVAPKPESAEAQAAAASVPPKPESASPATPSASVSKSTKLPPRTTAPRQRWIPEARMASADDLPQDDVSAEQPEHPVFAPLPLPRPSRLPALVVAVVALALVGLAAFFLGPWRKHRTSAEHSEAAVPNSVVETKAPAAASSGAPAPETTKPVAETSTTPSAVETRTPVPSQGEAARVPSDTAMPAAGTTPADSADVPPAERERRKREAEVLLAEEEAKAAMRLAQEKAQAVEQARSALLALQTGTPVTPAPEPATAASPAEAASVTSPAAPATKPAEPPEPAPAVPEPKDSAPMPDAKVPTEPTAEKAPETPAQPAPDTKTEATPAASPQEGNSLGMKFVPVGDVQFCIWPTRVRDYSAYANDIRLTSTAWRQPGFKQGPDNPVIRISFNHAVAFCKWLTDRERKQGTLGANEMYRLPTDQEWSKAVGLPDEPGRYPQERDGKVPNVFPWGSDWPPKENAGNYAGEEAGGANAIKGYQDGFINTSPVGSFPANALGLYDMGGNVWEWCSDSWTKGSTAKVLRGGSWQDGAKPNLLWSSTRLHVQPDAMTVNYGFRVVKAPVRPSAGKP